MICDNYSQNQKDLYDYMIKALICAGPISFLSCFSAKDMGQTLFIPNVRALILFFQKKRTALFNNKSDLSGLLPSLDL